MQYYLPKNFKGFHNVLESNIQDINVKYQYVTKYAKRQEIPSRNLLYKYKFLISIYAYLDSIKDNFQTMRNNLFCLLIIPYVAKCNSKLDQIIDINYTKLTLVK